MAMDRNGGIIAVGSVGLYRVSKNREVFAVRFPNGRSWSKVANNIAEDSRGNIYLSSGTDMLNFGAIDKIDLRLRIKHLNETPYEEREGKDELDKWVDSQSIENIGGMLVESDLSLTFVAKAGLFHYSHSDNSVSHVTNLSLQSGINSHPEPPVIGRDSLGRIFVGAPDWNEIYRIEAGKSTVVVNGNTEIGSTRWSGPYAFLSAPNGKMFFSVEGAGSGLVELDEAFKFPMPRILDMSSGIQISLGSPRGMTSDGIDFFVSDAYSRTIYRIDRAFRSSVVAGQPSSYGGPRAPDGPISLRADFGVIGFLTWYAGSLVFADMSGVVRSIGSDGNLKTLAGISKQGSEPGPIFKNESLTGRPAAEVSLGRISGLAIGRSGEIYFVIPSASEQESQKKIIVTIDQDGTLLLVAGA